jgi:hypothetical protein
MKLLTAPTTPPWMDIALEEYKKYKGINENQSPLKEKILEYFDLSFFKSGKHYDAWCSAFVNWCFEQTNDYKDINSGANSLAFDWGPAGNSKAKAKSASFGDGWVEGEKSEPFIGAVVVLKYSHCAFIVGKNSKLDKYVYVGGNQGSGKKGTQQIRYGTVTIGNEYAIMKPKKYKVQSYDLPEMAENADGNYESTR